jgi:hypothetical protein
MPRKKAVENETFANFRDEMKLKLVAAIQGSGLTYKRFADAYNRIAPAENQITEGGVMAWVRSGRIHKMHIPYLAELTGNTPEYFLGAEEEKPKVRQLTVEARKFAEAYMDLPPEAKVKWATALSGVVMAAHARPALPPLLEGLVDRLKGMSEDKQRTIVSMADLLISAEAGTPKRGPSKPSKAYAEHQEKLANVG